MGLKSNGDAANSAVERIYEYHQSHPDEDVDGEAGAQWVSFLQEQAKQISSTNVLYTIASLGLFLFSTSIMLILTAWVQTNRGTTFSSRRSSMPKSICIPKIRSVLSASLPGKT